MANRYKLIAENANDLIAILNERYEYEYINEKPYEKILGYSKKDLIGKSCMDLIHPLDLDKAIKSWKKGLIKGEEMIELRFKNKEGNYIWFEVKGTSLYGKDMKGKGLVISRDITKHKQMEEKLKEQYKKTDILNQIITSGNKAKNLSILLEDILDFILDLMNFDGGAIYLVNRTTRIAEIVSHKGFPLEFIKEVRFRKIDEKPYSIIFIMGEPIFAENYQEIETEISVKWGLLSIASIPIFTKDKIIGALNIASTSRYSFTNEEKDVLKSIGREIGTLIEKMQIEKFLRESEEKYRLISENANDLISVINDKYEIEYINEQVYKRTLGYSNEDLIGKTALNIIHPDDLNYAVKTLQDSIIKGDGIGQVRVRNKKGEYFWFEVRGTVFTDKIGEIKGLIISRDITERKQMEEKLKDSEAKYRGILENMSEGYFENDLKGNYTFLNDCFSEMIDYSKEEMLGKNYSQFYTDKTAAYLYKLYNQIYKEDNPIPAIIEYPGYSRKGKHFFLEGLISLKYDSEGKKIGFSGLIRDIMKRKEAEQKLKESEIKHRRIIENLNDFIAILDTKLYVEYVNEKTMYKILGYRNEDIIGKSVLKFVHPDDLNRAIKTIRTGAKVGEAILELRIKHKDGSWIWFECKGKSFVDKNGEKKAQLIGRDITERKKAEEELRKINELKTEFLRRTSHELKTPLVSIKGFSDLLLNLYRDEFNPDTISIVKEIKQGCLRLENLIGDILESSKLESYQIQLKPTKEDLSFLINFCVKELKILAETRNQKIILNIQDNLITHFEKEKIYEVISNLLSNAIKNTPPNGVIEIQSEVKNNRYIVSVKDNGIGLTNEEKNQLFKQFGKIERYGQGLDLGIEGTGLGLYISKKIVELHGGKIWAESEGRNKGSTFYFSLPIIKE